MSQIAYVHGATDAREVARLEKQADFTSAFTFPTLDLEPGLRVLDLATGVGAMAARLLHFCPGIQLIGVDLSAAQLAAARRNHPELSVVHGDATRLPFPDATFDRVHCSWLLEHVPSPVAVLEEVRRVLRPGGLCHFIEVDNATFQTTPACPSANEVMRRLNEAQLEGGGDPFVGRKLESAFTAAGFARFEVERRPLLGDSSNQDYFHAFVDEFVDIFAGLDESLGAEAMPVIARGMAELRALPRIPGGSIGYTPAIARAWR